MPPAPEARRAYPNGAIAAAYDAARLRILRSLERGEIDVAEAGRRLETLDAGDVASAAGRTGHDRRIGRPMADDAIERVLRLVERGSPDVRRRPDRSSTPWPTGRPRPSDPPPTDPSTPNSEGPARALRIEVRESGRTVVNLRVPLSLGRAAINRVPGISELTSERIREAIAAGIKGSIVEVEDEDGGVRISIE